MIEPKRTPTRTKDAHWNKTLVFGASTALIAFVLTQKPVAIGSTQASSVALNTSTAGKDLTDIRQPFADLATQVVQSVVNIATESEPKRAPPAPYGQSPFGNGFPFFGPPQLPGQPPQQYSEQYGDVPTYRSHSLGTGFVIETDQTDLSSSVKKEHKVWILTNYHVIQAADDIQVAFTEIEEENAQAQDGKSGLHKAKLVGKDPELDVALLEVKTKESIRPLRLGNSDSLRVGEYVAAVGNPFSQGHSMSHGIISAKERSAPELSRGGGLTRYLQTDAPINPGNSGGPLINLAGEVIGINNAIDARAQGIGFAIPINSVTPNLAMMKEKGYVPRGYLGVDIGPALDSRHKMKQVQVMRVRPLTPADKAGLEPGDILVSINGKKVHSPTDLTREVMNTPVGKNLDLEIERKTGIKKSIKISVGERPMG